MPSGYGRGVPPMKHMGINLHNTLQYVCHVNRSAHTHSFLSLLLSEVPG